MSKGIQMESDDDETLFDRPNRGTRLRRSITARLGRKRIKRIRALIKKREDRNNEKRIRPFSRKARTRIRH
jgi:hypothetical protein